MKDITLNNLDSSQRRILQFGIVIILAIFLAGYFFFTNKPKVEEPTKDTTVYIENSILHVFGKSTSIAKYPNRVSVHYPYLLVIKPGEQLTQIYNLEKKEKVKDIKESLLDYFNDSTLKNSGKSTFYNDQDLGVLCEKGLIKNDLEVLCLTKIETNSVENKLVTINLETKKQKEIYSSKNIITDFSLINDTVYMGEIDLFTKKNYLIFDDQKIETPTVVSLIYQMDGKPYFATVKSALSEKEIYYGVENDKIKEVADGKVDLNTILSD